MKLCRKCGRLLSIEEFRLFTCVRGGKLKEYREGSCRTCRNLRTSLWTSENKKWRHAGRAEYMRKWRAANPYYKTRRRISRLTKALK